MPLNGVAREMDQRLGPLSVATNEVPESLSEEKREETGITGQDEGKGAWSDDVFAERAQGVRTKTDQNEIRGNMSKIRKQK